MLAGGKPPRRNHMNRYIEIENDSELFITCVFVAGLIIGVIAGLLIGDWTVLG
jgi:hypothetical protein